MLGLTAEERLSRARADLRIGAPVAVTKWLMGKCPKALLIPNIHGDTPLHICVNNSKDIDIALLTLLLDRAPDCLEFRNSS